MNVKFENNKITLSGDLTYKAIEELDKLIKDKKPKIIDITPATHIDTSFLLYLLEIGIEIIANEKQQQLLDIVKEHSKTQCKESPHWGFFARVGLNTVKRLKEFCCFLCFVGAIFIEAVKLALKPQRIRIKEIVSDIELMGFNAIPILATISFLVGAVIAYHGAVRLKQFGANIFVVDIVSISVLRELGPLLVAILLAGRSASSYTTQIGIMKVTEEIDVIKTMGVEPFDVLVFPKIFSMLISIPLLIILADIAGVLGGMVVAKLSLNVTARDFILRLHHAVSVRTFLAGILKAPAFAFLIASIGAYKGFRTEKNVESIGKSVTISVVDSIFAVIIADAIFSVLFRWMGM